MSEISELKILRESEDRIEFKEAKELSFCRRKS